MRPQAPRNGKEAELKMLRQAHVPGRIKACAAAVQASSQWKVSRAEVRLATQGRIHRMLTEMQEKDGLNYWRAG